MFSGKVESLTPKHSLHHLHELRILLCLLCLPWGFFLLHLYYGAGMLVGLLGAPGMRKK